MKDLKNILNEAIYLGWKGGVEGTDSNKGAEVYNCIYDGTKKYGFIAFEDEMKLASFITVDNAQSLADLWDAPLELCERLLKMKVGATSDVSLNKEFAVTNIFRLW